MPIGATDERKSNAGITHLIEHLCFRKANEFSQVELYDFCESRGVKINAITGKNFLLFYFKARPSVYDDVVKLFHKMFYDIDYKEVDLAIEKSIIKAEIDEYEPTNSTVIIDRLWNNRKYANKILGSIESLESLSLEDVIQFKKKILKINGTVFLFGNYSYEQYNLTQNLFQTITYRTNVKDLKVKNNFITKNEVKFINDEYDKCDVYYALRFNVSNADRRQSILCLQMINSVLFQGDAAYITETLRERFGYVYEIDSRLEILRNEAILMFNLRVNKVYICETIYELENLLKSFIFNTKYHKYIKAFFCENIEMLYDNFDSYVEQCVENFIIFGEPIYPEEKAREINKILLSTYNSIYEKLIKNKSVYIFGNVSSVQKRELSALLKA